MTTAATATTASRRYPPENVCGEAEFDQVAETGDNGLVGGIRRCGGGRIGGVAGFSQWVVGEPFLKYFLSILKLW